MEAFTVVAAVLVIALLWAPGRGDCDFYLWQIQRELKKLNEHLDQRCSECNNQCCDDLNDRVGQLPDVL